MPSAWTALANITLETSATNVTFSSISGSYRDLVLVVAGNPNSNDYLSCRFNGDTGSNYYGVELAGASAGGSPASYSYSSSHNHADYNLPYDSNQKIQSVITILDYTATDKHKPSLIRTNYPNNGYTALSMNRWANTSAITSMLVYQVNGSQFAAGMTFALYGVSS